MRTENHENETDRFYVRTSNIENEIDHFWCGLKILKTRENLQLWTENNAKKRALQYVRLIHREEKSTSVCVLDTVNTKENPATCRLHIGKAKESPATCKLRMVNI